MGGRFVARAAAGVLSLALSGCFGPSGSWQWPSFMRPTPATYRSTPAAQGPPANAGGERGSAVPAENETPAPNRRSRHTANHVVPVAVPPPAPPPPQPSQKPTVTLADGPSKDRALQLLDETGAKLARVDRNRLTTDSATTYYQANGFLQSGRRAATEEDYVAASGFAEKAAVLAAKLVPASR
jgi:hypothetical protein